MIRPLFSILLALLALQSLSGAVLASGIDACSAIDTCSAVALRRGSVRFAIGLAERRWGG